MPTSPKPTLQSHCLSVCEDAVFVVASSGKFDGDHLVETARRRAGHYDAVLRRTAEPSPGWDAWTVAMCATIASFAPPPWLPMHEVVEALTLGAGARGVRSLFTSKPSERQIQRTKAIGSSALRFMTAVLGAGRALDDEQRLLRRCFVYSLGVPEDEATVLLAELAAPIEAIAVPEELDTKLARAVARGLWDCAVRDGVDPDQDAMSSALSARLGLSAELTDTLRREAKAQIETRRLVGLAAVDAVRYVLSDDKPRARELALITARLALAPVHRTQVSLAIEQGDPVVLAKRHALEREDRNTALTLAWLAALSADPTQTRAAEMAVRHDRVATDLGTSGEGRAAREAVEGFVREQLLGAVQSAGL